jgi:hypothetical protein
MDMLVAPDFFTAEVWTWSELVTYDVSFSIYLWSRRVQVAGATPHPNEPLMMQTRESEAHTKAPLSLSDPRAL